MNQPDLIVMAAGIGSRYGGLKQIEPIGPNGEIILDYSIYDALRAGFSKVVFVINREIELDFRKRIESTIEPRCHVEYVFQELDDIPAGITPPALRTKPWGTAHAVLSCRSRIHNPFAVVNADDFYGRTAYQALYSFLCDNNLQLEDFRFCMAGYILENTLTEHGSVARGVCEVDQAGYLEVVQERTHVEKIGQVIKYSEDGNVWHTLPGNSVVSMNMWGFTPIFFNELEERFSQFLISNQANLLQAEFFLPHIVNDLLQECKATVKVLPVEDQWYGMTYKADKPRIQKAVSNLIKLGEYPLILWG